MKHMIVVGGIGEWSWRDSEVQPVINWDGSYDWPVIHRGDCGGRHKSMFPEISEPALVSAWQTELVSRRRGTKRVEFCEHCVCRSE